MSISSGVCARESPEAARKAGRRKYVRLINEE